jgi:RNA polymerase sigma-70 factor, ECF subfamily
VDKEQSYARLLEPLLTQAGGYARSILRHREDVADAVQQAALRGLEHWHTFDPSRPFKGWWFAILRNTCVDILRGRRASKTEHSEIGEASHSASCDGPDWQYLTEAIGQLSEPHREILRLRYFGDLSYRELSESLGIPQGTVMSRLYLARKALQARLIEGRT